MRDRLFSPFREAMQYSIHLVLDAVKPRFALADIAAVCGISAPMLSKVACGTTTLENTMLVAEALRMGYTFTITNGIVTFTIEPLDVVIDRCLSPEFTFKRRNKT